MSGEKPREITRRELLGSLVGAGLTVMGIVGESSSVEGKPSKMMPPQEEASKKVHEGIPSQESRGTSSDEDVLLRGTPAQVISVLAPRAFSALEGYFRKFPQRIEGTEVSSISFIQLPIYREEGIEGSSLHSQGITPKWVLPFDLLFYDAAGNQIGVMRKNKFFVEESEEGASAFNSPQAHKTIYDGLSRILFTVAGKIVDR